ncbi:unnamed protein product [Psylliodes chrysocephalus]|uniref:Laminin G domain-containing protein n=1 Tax=Psylliodes chrysocephalus TaxID=3402493 RepID=A0A9P0GJJ8_9CUCU|nr:unnamed protein product [Psylliodes chrysocephala]
MTVGFNAKLSIREELQDGNEYITPVEKSLSGPYTIFNLDNKNSKIFVGSIPNNYQVAEGLDSGSFDGEMEDLVIGNTPLSLWNFNYGYENNHGALERNKLVNLAPSNGYRFNGNGYAILDARSLQFRSKSTIQLYFKTFAKTGLLFLAGKGKTFISIEMQNGKVLYQYNLGNATKKWVTSNNYNDGAWHKVTASRDGAKGKLVVDSEDVIDRTVPVSGVTLEFIDTISFGGYPNKHNYEDVTEIRFDGCITNATIMGEAIDLRNNIKAFDVEPGCPDKWSSMVSFIKDDNHYVGWDKLALTNEFNMSLKFKTNDDDGLIFYISDSTQDNIISLSLSDGHLVLVDQKIELKSKGIYNDSQWHVVSVIHNDTYLRMDIDDMENQVTDAQPPYIHTLAASLYVGGLPRRITTNPNSVAAKTSFYGCIADLTVNGKVKNFANTTDRHSEMLDKCIFDNAPADIDHSLPELTPIETIDYYTTPSQEITTVNAEGEFNTVRGDGGNDFRRPINEVDFKLPVTEVITTEVPPRRVGTLPPVTSPPPPTDKCALPLSPVQENVQQVGYRFVNQDSRLECNSPRGKYKKNFDFRFHFKTKETEGILFYISDSSARVSAQEHKHYAAVYLSGGQVVFSFRGDGDALIIKSKGIYNDSKWHLVEFNREQGNGKLVIDDEDISTGSLGNKPLMLDLHIPFYIGGLNPDHYNSVQMNLNTTASFSGCIKDISMNSKALEPSAEYGVIPCSDDVEIGTFFGGEAHTFMKLKDKYKVGVMFSIKMDIKPRVDSGVLVAAHGKKDYYVLELINGTVRLHVENGKGPFSATFVPPNNNPFHLCDGQWHNIQAVKSKNVVTLSVDNLYTDPRIGPHSVSTDTGSALFLGGHRFIKKVRAGSLYVGDLPRRITTSPNSVAAKTSFYGCIADLTVNGKVKNFANTTDRHSEMLDKCIFDNAPADIDHSLPELTPIETIDYYTTPSQEITTLNAEGELNTVRGDGGNDFRRPINEVDFTLPVTEVITTEVPPRRVGTLPPVTSPPPPTDKCALPLSPVQENVQQVGYRFVNQDSRLECNSPRGKYKKNFDFRFHFKTKETEGILFYISDSSARVSAQEHKHYAAVYLSGGQVVFSFRGDGDALIIKSKGIYNDSKWHLVEFNREQGNGKLVIDDEDISTGSLGNKPLMLDLHIPFYIGGLNPDHYNSVQMNLNTTASFSGCIKDISMNSKALEPSAEYGVIPCSDDVEIGTFFGGEAHTFMKLKDKYKVGVMFSIKMDIKPRVDSGVLVAAHGKKDYYVLELINGTVRLHVENGKGPFSATFVPPNNNPFHLCDGQWHNIQEELQPVLTLSQRKLLFSGCIADLTVNGKVKNFANTTDRHSEMLDKCIFDNAPADIDHSLPELTPIETIDYYTTPSQEITTVNAEGELNTVREVITTEVPPRRVGTLPPVTSPPPPTDKCALPLSPVQENVQQVGYRFVNQDSRLECNSPRGKYKKNFDFRFHFKTKETEGILFYISDSSARASTQEHKHYAAVYLSGGQVVFSFRGDGDALVIKSKGIYNDSKWHLVEFNREQGNGKLVIDDEDISTGSLGNKPLMLDLHIPFYIGGLNPDHYNSVQMNLNTTASFSGCIKDISMNSKALEPSAEYGVIPCSDDVEIGTFFGGEAHTFMKLKDKYKVGVMFSIKMDIKPRVDSGVLVAAHGKKDYYVLELINGTVRLHVENGKGPFSATFVPPNNNPFHLCDGQWHNIQAGSLCVGDLPRRITTSPNSVAAKTSFYGCIADLTVNGKVKNFANTTDRHSEMLDKCIFDNAPADIDHSLPELPPIETIDYYTTPSQEITTLNAEGELNTVRGDGGNDFRRPINEVDFEPPVTEVIPPKFLREELVLYHRFVNQDSRLECNTPRGKYKKNFDFRFHFKTKETEGILFYISDSSARALAQEHKHYAAVYLSGGQVVFSFRGDGDALIIKSKGIYNDSKWHLVEFNREQGNGKLVIDDEDISTGSLGNKPLMLDLHMPFYIGGLNPDHYNSVQMNLNTTASFSGCIKDISMNSKALEPSAEYGVIPCSDDVEIGTFFGGEAHTFMKLKDKYKVGVMFSIKMDIKPRGDSGVLVAAHGKKDYYVLELINGTVRLHVENGKGPFSATFVPPNNNPFHLCDG